MKYPQIKTFAAVGIIAAAASLTGCLEGETTEKVVEVPESTVTQAYVDKYLTLKGDYTSDITLTTGKTYKIDGEVNIKDGATLTIPAGTKLYGYTGSSYLAINAGAKIMAEGTASAPIIFTSAQDISGTAKKDDQGQWGGLTIIGKAPIHGGTKTYEAGTQVGGGTDAADNSGVLKYVMVKHTGYEIEADKELNGISFLAVGSGTTVENIASIGSADDGIELWGGSVNLKNVYVYNAGDDSLDTDSGYQGTIENAVVIQKVVDKTNYDSSGVESGNDKDTYTVDASKAFGSSDATSSWATLPTLKDATIETVGGAIYLKNDSGYKFDNVRVTVKASTVSGQTDTANQAIITHRTKDVVDDETSPLGVTIVNGLVLDNQVNPSDIWATRTAKDESSDGETTTATYTKTFWTDVVDGANDRTATSYAGKMYSSDVAVDLGASVKSTAAQAITGADQSAFNWVLDVLNAKTTEVVSGDISVDTTWSEGTNYALQGEVNVKSGATLTIQPGVTVYGLTQSSYLAINAGAMIMAEGTQAKPIVFTSAADVAGDNGSTTKQGQWGGLTIVGNAPIVGGSKTYEAGTQVGGGTSETDNSGSLKYVVIKNSGFEVEADKELNGLSMLAVGSGTTVENIAILSSADDGVEFWGGSVNVKGLYVFDAGDDSLDTDLGYTGTLEDVYVQQYTVDKTNYDSSGIESGNDSDSYTSLGGVQTQTSPATADLSTLQQATMATYKNVTIEAVGGAIYLKNDAGGIFDNVSVISKDVQDSSQTATSGQAVVTHRTTDTVDDLSGSPYGVQIVTTNGGLELINEVVATDIYATRTAKDDASGGNTTNASHTKDYWHGISGITVDTTGLFESDNAAVTGATIANVWKGKAGSNDK